MNQYTRRFLRYLFMITIDKPCNKQWQNMLKSGQGRFCNACQTTVIDFTAYSEEELKGFFSAYAGQHICGRFKPEQLNAVALSVSLKDMAAIVPRHKWIRLLLFVVMSSSLFSCTDMQGNKKPVAIKVNTGTIPDKGNWVGNPYHIPFLNVMHPLPDTAKGFSSKLTPQFLHGDIIRYVINNTCIPVAIDTSRSAVVRVTFTVKKDGSVKDIKIEDADNTDINCQEQVLNMMKALPAFAPGQLDNGTATDVRCMISVSFKQEDRNYYSRL